MQELHHEAPAEGEPQQGFYLDYVLQACPAPGQHAAPLPGPHTMELILKGASLHWPYLTRLEFVAAIAEAYSHCFIKPWAAPNPPVRYSLQATSACIPSRLANILKHHQMNSALAHAQEFDFCFCTIVEEKSRDEGSRKAAASRLTTLPLYGSEGSNSS